MISSTLNVETVASRLLDVYGIQSPPVPIEAILQHPMPDMWEKVDLSAISGTFFAMDDPYRPRLAVARLLVRLLSSTEWGIRLGLAGITNSSEQVYHQARAILAPRSWLAQLPAASLTPPVIRTVYQLPLSEAMIRLQELGVDVN
ncbi:MAG: hypothetical protein U0452_08345 [Anaerolineae bacterium]